MTPEGAAQARSTLGSVKGGRRTDEGLRLERQKPLSRDGGFAGSSAGLRRKRSLVRSVYRDACFGKKLTVSVGVRLILPE